MKINTNIKFLFSVTLLALIVLLGACQKEKEPVLSEGTENGSKFIFSVSSQLKLANSNKLASLGAQNSKEASIVSLSNTIKVIAESNEDIIRKSLSSSKNIKVASSSPVHVYTRYRLLLFNVTEGKLEKNIDAEASHDLEVDVKAGNEYRWYAYSYNTAERVPPPTIESVGPVIRTEPDKEFLWASSSNSITASGTSMPLSITFEHKVAEVIIEIDTKDLYGAINDLEIEFNQPNYLNTAKINLQTGAISEIMDYAAPILDVNSFLPTPGHPTKLQARVYTANPENLDQGQNPGLTIKINKLTAVHHDGEIRELHKTTDPAKLVSFTFTNPHVSKSHVASLNLRYLLKTKRILHVTGIEHGDDTKWAFAAQPATSDLTAGWSSLPANNRPPFNMIKEVRNYGTLSNSIVYTEGFTHLRCLNDHTLDQKLTAAGQVPDIVIVSIYYNFDTNDIVELKNYIDKGGVVIMMTDSGVPSEVTTVQSFMNTLFGRSDIALNAISLYSGGTMFQLRNDIHKDGIIDGPFGNFQGKYWGVDTHPAILANNIPLGTGLDQATYYSDNTPVNKAINGNGVPMFRHNSKNFFWIGDGSFLSTNANTSSGWRVYETAEPFATVNTSGTNPVQSHPDLATNPNTPFNYDHYPVPKSYNSSSQVYNAPLFANLMAWAVYQSEFFGINTGGLKRINADVKDWIINQDSINVNF